MFCGVKVNIVINEKDPNLKKALSRLRSNPEYLSIFSNAADAQDMITSETLLVVCDVNNREKFESPEIADNIFNMVVIDHHRKTAEYARNPIITYIEPSASSACELVVEILEQSIPAGTLPKDEADIMFAEFFLTLSNFHATLIRERSVPLCIFAERELNRLILSSCLKPILTILSEKQSLKLMLKYTVL